MTKREMANEIADKLGLHRKETLDVVSGVFELIKREVKNDQLINIRDFGSFGIKHIKARNQNVIGKGVIEVPARNKVYFKPSSISFKVNG